MPWFWQGLYHSATLGQMRLIVVEIVECQDMPANDCQQLYSNLVTAVIRVGQADDALSLMKERKLMWMGRDSGMGQSRG